MSWYVKGQLTAVIGEEETFFFTALRLHAKRRILKNGFRMRRHPGLMRVLIEYIKLNHAHAVVGRR